VVQGGAQEGGSAVSAQGELDFVMRDPPPRTRNTDPITSHEAEARVRSDGTMGDHAGAVLELIRAHPGSTGTQLAQYPHPLLGADATTRRYQIMRRVSDLTRNELIRSGGKNGRGNTADFLSGMAKTLPPMMQVLRDIGGVDFPESMIKFDSDATTNGTSESTPSKVAGSRLAETANDPVDSKVASTDTDAPDQTS